MIIIAVAVGLGLGVDLRPDVLQQLPEWPRTFFGSGLITGGLSAAAMDFVFPGRD
jgi:xanthine/uracil permease